LELVTKNEKRAAETENPQLKKIFLDLAAGYRELAEQIDDPELWRARMTASPQRRSGGKLKV
jgi:hypothetical protein